MQESNLAKMLDICMTYVIILTKWKIKSLICLNSIFVENFFVAKFLIDDKFIHIQLDRCHENIFLCSGVRMFTGVP